MRHVRFIASLAIMLLAALPIQAQTENQAFYIYQNDGHFNGFFYDEIEKMSFSFLDTLGVEHDEIVSQEIFTADSVYRIMLSAIDSIGFVQPEVKYCPKVRNMANDYLGNWRPLYSDYENVFSFNYFGFSSFDHSQAPHIGDILVDFNIEGGYAAKVISVENDGQVYTAHCEPVEDITDIFQNFVGVEQYGFDDNGQMVRRRVAGHPELNIGQTRRRASEGQWEGDLFNFALSGHIPLYSTDVLYIGIDPAIDGRLHIKATWNMSLFGDKYIGIESRLNFGVGCGFTIDGKIADFFPGGIGGLLGGVPIPATTPLIYLDIAPDAFLRGEAHVKFSASSPKLQAAMWSKLEIKNWVPSIGIGFGNPDGEKFEYVDNTSKGLKLELNGFIQAGMLFPMKFKSLPILKKVFNASIGGNWFVGPKMAGSIALDLTTAPWDDVAAYNQLKNTTLSLHMLDADYEVKADVETLFSGKKNVTLADGSISLFPPFDASLVPEFKDPVEYYEERWVGNEKMNCRIIAFEPTGYVIKPVKIGVAYADISENQKPLYEMTDMTTSYYHFAKLLGQPLNKDLWAEKVLPLPTPEQQGGWYNGAESKRYIVRPVVKLIENQTGFIATPEITILHGVEAKISSDSLWLNYDLTDAQPIKVTGDVDVPDYGEQSELKATKISGGYDIGKGPGFRGKRNYSPCDTLEYYTTVPHSVIGTFKGSKFRPLGLSEPRYVHIFTLPNTSDPTGVYFYLSIPFNTSKMSGRTIEPDDPNMSYDIVRRSDNMGWDIVANWSNLDYSMHLSYTVVTTEEGRLRLPGGKPNYALRDVQLTYMRKFTEKETYTIKATVDNHEFTGDYMGGRVGITTPATYIVNKDGGSTSSTEEITMSIGTMFE